MLNSMFFGMNDNDKSLLVLLGWLRTHTVADYAKAGTSNHNIAQELRAALLNYGNAIVDHNAQLTIAQATNLLNNV